MQNWACRKGLGVIPQDKQDKVHISAQLAGPDPWLATLMTQNIF